MSGRGPVGHWQRFFAGGELNLIQCAEQLEAPAGVLRESLSNCTWFPIPGTYRERLHDRPADLLPGVAAWSERQITVPGNYGRIWSNE